MQRSGGRRLVGVAFACAVMAATGGLAQARPRALSPTFLSAFTQPFAGKAAADDAPGAMAGAFSDPFTEPTIDGRTTTDKCIAKDGAPAGPAPGVPPLGDNRYLDCKPAGVSVNVLPDGRVMYYDGLEGTENVRTSIVAEYGHNAGNDQSRVLDLKGEHPSWSIPSPADGGANPDSNAAVLPPPFSSVEDYNNGALFCSDNKFLADGTVISLGGSNYYNEPGVDLPDGSNYGVTELEGLKNARIFNPRDDRWTQTGPMQYGRWYPTAITEPNGSIFVASGVTKLLKPAYPDRPTDSGTNVVETETYDPGAGRWSLNDPATANRSLPLFPRLHLLPDGKIFYAAAGQSFNPAGQSYDEATWNEAAVYDPATKSWTDVGVPGVEAGAVDPAGDPGNPVGDVTSTGIPGLGSAMTIPGFRGSTFSIMLPLKVDDKTGNYDAASFLQAGGVLNPPSPGSYFATSDSRILTVDTAAGDLMSTRPTGDLSQPRWYGSGVLLPTGQVLAFNGSDRDEVAGPGMEIAIQKTELFDPATNQWTTLASSHQPRTYHNTAVLLPDGRVLVGGHAPISTLYLNDTTVPGGFAPHDGRDPSFEIYSPPYLFDGDRPKIEGAPDRIRYGRTFDIDTDVKADDVDSVVLVRNPSVTHLVDADQRNVVLPVVGHGDELTVQAPPDGAVAPPGPYMLFVNRKGDHGAVPSVSRQVFLGLETFHR